MMDAKENLFIRAAIRHGYISQQIADECSEHLRKIKQQGHPKSIQEVMMEAGALSAQQVQQIQEKINLAMSSWKEHPDSPVQTAPKMQEDADATCTDVRTEGVHFLPVHSPEIAVPNISWNGPEDNLDMALATMQDANIDKISPGTSSESSSDISFQDIPVMPSKEKVSATEASQTRLAMARPQSGQDEEIEKIGRYKILDRLGSGAMGAVYKAEDDLLKRCVAIKVLLESATLTEEQRQRFLLEAQATAKMSHPNIVSLYDIGEISENRFYLVMEYIEGNTLKEVIQEKPCFPISEAVEIVRQIADAINMAHGLGIIHRDIKPANILMTQSGIPKIADFGLAKVASEGSISVAGQILGTPYYMAPEQIEGRHVDGRIDIYALGITLYQMLTGHLPFRGSDVYNVLIAHMHQDPTPIKTYRPEVPDALSRIVLCMIAKDPNQRFQNGQAVIEALSRFVQGETSTGNLRSPLKKEERTPTERYIPEPLAPLNVEFGEKLSPSDESSFLEELPLEKEPSEKKEEAIHFLDEKKPLSGARPSQEKPKTISMKEAPQTKPKTISMKEAPQSRPKTISMKEAPQTKPKTVSMKEAPQSRPKTVSMKEAPPIDSPKESSPIKPKPVAEMRKANSPSWIKRHAMGMGILGIVFVLAPVLYFLNIPPALPVLKLYVETGDKERQEYALGIFEKYGDQRDIRAVPVLMAFLNHESLTVRRRSRSILKKYGDTLLSSVTEILESPSPDYSLDAKIELIKLLEQMNAIQAKRQILGICESYRAPKPLRQAAIETLVVLFPEYNKEYFMKDGVWYTSREMKENGYVHLNGRWAMTSTLLDPIQQSLEVAKNKKDWVEKRIVSFVQPPYTLMSRNELLRAIDPWNDCTSHYQKALSSIEASKKYGEENEEIKKRLKELEEKAAQEILQMGAKWLMSIEEMEGKGWYAYAWTLLSSLNQSYLKIAQWPWSKEIQANFVKVSQERRKLSHALLQKAEFAVVLETEEKTKSQVIPLAQETIESLFWKGQKKAVLTDKESLQQRKIKEWAMVGYFENIDRNGIQMDIQFWENQEFPLCVWKESIPIEKGDDVKLDAQNIAQFRVQAWESLRKKEIPWKEMQRMADHRREQERVRRQLKMDEIHFRDGKIVKGLIRNETEEYIELFYMRKSVTGQSVLSSRKIVRKDIHEIIRMSDDIRKKKLEQLEKK